MAPAIKIEGISKKFKKTAALKGIDLEVEEGMLYGLIGPDGAGKSTLYTILTTLVAPDKGRGEIFGLDLRKDSRRIRDIIGYMPQRFSLFPDLSVRENLEFFASLFGQSVERNFDMIAPVYSQLARFPRRRAGALSGGMKQKLALCCALIHKPRLLLLDEPTTGVDAISRSEFWEILRQLKAGGMSILVSTSYMDEAQLCDRISLIDRGRILQTGTVPEILAGHRERIYNVSASEMFPLLEAVREFAGVRDCYTFGATLHAVVGPEFNPADAQKALAAKGLKDVEIYPAKGDIEDVFINLMGNE